MRPIGIILFVLFLSGCASMSAEECLTADWQAIGIEDGARGAPVSAVTSRRQVCAKKASVTVDMAAYMAGRDIGLVEFCQPANGYALGSRGDRYHGVCNGPEERTFVAAFEAGRQLYSLEKTVSSAEAHIRQAQHDLHDVDKQITQTEVAMIAPEMTVQDRLQIFADLKRLSERKGNIETALIVLHRDHVRAQDELAEYHRFIAFNGPYPNAATAPRNASY